jgi:hypothetical protein
MRNYWVQKANWFYAWRCSLDPLQVTIRSLSEFAIAVNDLLEKENILVVDSFDNPRSLYRYRRVEHGSMATFCRQLFEQQGLIQFPFADLESEDNAVNTTLAYYNANNKLVEKPVQDLGLLLRDLEPVPGAISGYLRRRGFSPIVASGLVFKPSDIRNYQTVGFGLHTYSNIWAPYCYWTGHPWSEQHLFFDNRPLAYRHTTRLNRVLSQLADMTAELGGTWTINEPGLFATERGINLEPILDAPVAEGAELVEWPDLFQEGLVVPEEERDYEFGR